MRAVWHTRPFAPRLSHPHTGPLPPAVEEEDNDGTIEANQRASARRRFVSATLCTPPCQAHAPPRAPKIPNRDSCAADVPVRAPPHSAARRAAHHQAPVEHHRAIRGTTPPAAPGIADRQPRRTQPGVAGDILHQGCQLAPGFSPQQVGDPAGQERRVPGDVDFSAVDPGPSPPSGHVPDDVQFAGNRNRRPIGEPQGRRQGRELASHPR